MKIIILSSMYPNSKVYMSGIFVHEHVKALKKLGVTITVFAPVPFSPFPLPYFSNKWKKINSIPSKEIIDGIDIIHTRYIALPGGLFKNFWPYFYILPIFFRLRKYNKNKFQFIHAHGSLPDDYSAKLLSKMLKIPYLVTVHGETVYMKKKDLHLMKSISAIREAKAVIGVSEKVIGRIQNLTGRVNNLFKVYNGFEVIKINQERIQKKNKEINILFAATLVERKGCEYVIKAFRKLIGKYENIYLTIAGGGELLNKLKSLSVKLNIDKYVTFLGSVEHKKMLWYMSISDIFILPSWDEAFGVVYLEAMSFKKPVIGTVGEGISEIIVDGENGFLVKPKNVDDIIEKLELLIESKKLRNKIGLKGFETIKRLTWENNAKKTLKIYKDILTNIKANKVNNLSSK